MWYLRRRESGSIFQGSTHRSIGFLAPQVPHSESLLGCRCYVGFKKVRDRDVLFCCYASSCLWAVRSLVETTLANDCGSQVELGWFNLS